MEINRYVIYLISLFIISLGASLEIQTEVVYLLLWGYYRYFSSVEKGISKGKSFFFDTSMVIIVAILSIVFLGYLAGVREGTIISAKNNPNMEALSLELWVSKER